MPAVPVTGFLLAGGGSVHAFLAAALFDRSFFKWLILLAVAFLYGFALFELAKSGSHGWVKAVWVVVIIAIPIIGALVYVMTTPSGAFATDPGHDRYLMDPEHPTDQAYGAGSPRPFG
jgi:hypothetical protein